MQNFSMIYENFRKARMQKTALKKEKIDFLELKERFKNYEINLKQELKKLQGKGFVNFISKESDELIKLCLNAVLNEIFDDFLPDLDRIPICIIATEKYAQNLVSLNSVLEILVVYKNSSGFNVKQILKLVLKALSECGLNLNIKTAEVGEIIKNFKNDFKAKAALSKIRFIAGSKYMYKLARAEIYVAREHDRQENLKHYMKIFGAFNEIKNLNQEPNLKSDFGGSDEIYYLTCALNGFENEISLRSQMLKFIDEKELSSLNLAIDFILCIKSAQNLLLNSDHFSSQNLSQITALMQTKSKKTQETTSIISQKLLSCMHTVGIYARYLTSSFYRSNFTSQASFNELKTARLKNGFYRIENTVYTPLKKRPTSLNSLLLELLELGDMDYKFDISAIFYIKRAVAKKGESEKTLANFKKLLQKNNSHCIIKALLDAGILLTIVKPMEHTRHLAVFDGYHKFSVDEHCVTSLKFLENIKDKFIKSLYDELCVEGKTMLKLVALLHDVGKGLAGDHSITGANIFRAYAMKLNLSAKAVNIGVTLVRYHTLMSDTANREDIYNQRTIFSFISKLNDKQTLKLLYILTYCVINATSEKLYNPYIARLLKEFYLISLESFEDENLLDEATRRVKKEHSIRRNPEFVKLSENLKDKIFSIPSNLLFIKYQPSDIINIANLAQSSNELNVFTQNHQNFSLKIIIKSHPNLALALSNLAHLDLAYMEIFELFDDKFYIRLEFNKNVRTSELESVRNLITLSLESNNKINVSKPTILKEELSFDTNHSKDYAKLCINAKDQRGLMAYVMMVFENLGIKIASARIQTIKNRTRNLFLIEKSDVAPYNENKILNLLISE
ncbi:HD domain-containing protein [Campylobacter sp. CCUG 57310]|uniref:HD domain-containing protein n=1 Tax=Campylobacter sp. CCUG 57310 TaxID=2517362 RepID=UPI0020B165C7|nr:HD domain-containing protein [Campylobacter sp. CCUG 57310]